MASLPYGRTYSKSCEVDASVWARKDRDRARIRARRGVRVVVGVAM